MPGPASESGGSKPTQLPVLLYFVPMVQRISTLDVRNRIGARLTRVALRHDEFVIERKGKPLAALVPIERLEQIRRFARLHALEFMARRAGGPLSETQAAALAAGAKRWARRRIRKSGRASA